MRLPVTFHIRLEDFSAARITVDTADIQWIAQQKRPYLKDGQLYCKMHHDGPQGFVVQQFARYVLESIKPEVNLGKKEILFHNGNPFNLTLGNMYLAQKTKEKAPAKMARIRPEKANAPICAGR